jgi:signal transduction histidine kinase
VGLLKISRVINPQPFTKSDVDRAAVLASQTLLALENMRLMRHAISSERLATVGQVATSIAHEVNNPIAYVLASQHHVREQLDHAIALCARLEGGTEVVELRGRLEEMRQVIEDVRDGAERVRDILRDTRALAQSHDTAIPIDVNEPIRSALRVVAAELRHRTMVTTQLADGLFVLGRPGRLSQVFVNLLVHMVERFGEAPGNEIVIASKLTGGHVVVTVRDNGPRVPSEHLPRLFDPFFTTNLAIARDILRNHGGEISVQAGEEAGTSFTMVLPQVAAPRVRPRTESPIAIHGARLRILMIDDEPNILKSYKRALGASHDLVFASHGQEALEAICTNGDFDLVVCDVSMPTMSGMQLFEHVRENEPALAARFVFATGGATQKSVEQFLASIPNLVLEKPFEMRVLRELVADLVRAS